MDKKEEVNSILVDEVRKRQFLYDPKHSDYSRRDLRDEAWKEISQIVSRVSPEMDKGACKKRWTNLRGSYATELTRSPRPAAAKDKTPYYMAGKMEFLKPYLQSAPQQEREPDVDDCHNDDGLTGPTLQSPMPHGASQQPTQPQQSTTPATPQEAGRSSEQDALCNRLEALAIPKDEGIPAVKTEPPETKQSSSARNDATKQFLLSLLPDLRKMNDNQFLQFRKKCLDAIEEILTQTH